MMGLTVQNFLSAAVGISVLFVLIRGFVKVKENGLGSFWTDLIRVVLYILMPLSIVVSILLVSQGVVQSFKSYDTVSLLEPITLEDGTIVDEAVVPLGPAASQVAIKQLGTNGGGFMGTNSAHPLEDPTPFSNIVEMLSILLIPAALCFTFGRNVKNKKQGIAIFSAMLIVLVVALGIIMVNEQYGTTVLSQNSNIDVSTVNQAGGNNGSAFAGFGADTVFLNISLALVMLFVRFVPMIATIAIAGSLAQNKKIAATEGTLATDNGMFVGLLIFVMLLVGALSFLPALALGQIGEFFEM